MPAEQSGWLYSWIFDHISKQGCHKEKYQSNLRDVEWGLIQPYLYYALCQLVSIYMCPVSRSMKTKRESETKWMYNLPGFLRFSPLRNIRISTVLCGMFSGFTTKNMYSISPCWTFKKELQYFKSIFFSSLYMPTSPF